MTTFQSAPRLQMHNVHKRFGGVLALQGASLELAPGQVHALLGENGAGKSTLISVLEGALQPDAGSMTLDGAAFAPGHPAAARRAGVAVVHQEPALAVHLTVAENIALGSQPARWGVVRRAAMHRAAAAALERIGAAHVNPAARVADLSPGARQLVEIARAAGAHAAGAHAAGAHATAAHASGARVLVLDEPTTSVGREQADGLWNAVRQLQQQGVSVLLVSHHLDEVRAVASHATVLRNGHTVWTGPLAHATDAALVRAMVGSANEPASAREPTAARESSAARQTAAAHPASAAPAVVLSATGVRTHRMRAACTVEARAGQVLGIAGLVGSGRTALLRALAGLDPLAAGQVTVDGRLLRPGVRAALDAGVALVSEDRRHEGLALDLPWSVNLALADLHHHAAAGVVAWKRVMQSALAWQQQLGIRAATLQQPARQLSGGNQQRVALARALQAGTRAILLDEPTRGVDVAAKAQIHALIRQMAAGGRAVVVVSSYPAELLQVCDAVALMLDGHLQPARAAAQCTEELLVSSAFRAQGGAA